MDRVLLRFTTHTGNGPPAPEGPFQIVRISGLWKSCSVGMGGEGESKPEGFGLAFVRARKVKMKMCFRLIKDDPLPEASVLAILLYLVSGVES